jgi:hypothetical protein
MSLICGQNRISRIYIGENRIKQVFLGEDKIFPTFPDPRWLMKQLFSREQPISQLPSEMGDVEAIHELSNRLAIYENGGSEPLTHEDPTILQSIANDLLS